MLIDARSLPDGEVINTDICIVGAGACGIALALEFIDAPFRVSLLESGGLKFKHRTQWLYRGENVGHDYFDLEFTRQRYFGGSTNKWYGRCRPLDSIDFEERDWVPNSGWPFSKDHLDPFYKRAHQVCELQEYNYDPKYWVTKEKRTFPLENTSLETKVFQHSPPSRFGQIYLEELINARNITTFLNANVTEIRLDEYGNKVTNLEVSTLNRRKFTFKAKYFLLAASGIENTRLLLISNKTNPKGIGNDHDLVGRYFMEHTHFFGGHFTETKPNTPPKFYTISNYGKNESNLGVGGAIGIKDEVLREERLLNSCSFFVLRPSYKNEDNYHTKAGLDLQKTFNTINHTTAPNFTFFQHFWSAIQNINISTNLLGMKLKHILKPQIQISLHTQSECIPNPESRITLSDKRDALGVKQVRLDWQPTRKDLDSLNRYLYLLDEGLNQLGLSFRLINHELDENQWPITLEGGKHYMGTTRMHKDHRKGVIDQNCQVHGIANLFISGASTFPTSGQANPTLTIVALAIRLADHVKQKMKKF